MPGCQWRDGRVLITRDGTSQHGSIFHTDEVCDPPSNRWEWTGFLSSPELSGVLHFSCSACPVQSQMFALFSMIWDIPLCFLTQSTQKPLDRIFSYRRTKVNPKHELRTTKLVLSKSQSQRMSRTPGRQRNSVPELLEPWQPLGELSNANQPPLLGRRTLTG